MKIKRLASLAVVLLLGFAQLIQTRPVQAATDPWWDLNVSASEAADLYCAVPSHAGTGLADILPAEGITITESGWYPVTLRNLGCAAAGERQITFFGLDYVNGQPPVDFSQSGLVNVTNETGVTDATNVQLDGDEIWMFDSGIVPPDGHHGNDIPLRINSALYPESGEYDTTLHGMGWFVSTTCPTPLSYDDIESGPSCDFTGGEKTNQETSFFNLLIDVVPPAGIVHNMPLGENGVAGEACNALDGWALDEDNPSATLTVKVYLQNGSDLEEIYSVTADAARDDQYNGHGFVVPHEILNQHINLTNSPATLVFKAIGVLQNGDQVGSTEGLNIGSTEVSACLPKSPDTGGRSSLPLTLAAITAPTLLGIFALKRKLARG